MYSILIIDDEPIVKIALRSILPWEEHGFFICGTASNGLEALSLIEKHHPDVIITDLKMPEMNGIEALKEIRKKDTNIPIIMQSAYAFENDMEAARAAGSNGFITKPINIVELKKTISKFLPQIIW